MTTRRRLLFGLIVVAVVLAVCVWLLWPGPSAISGENFEMIQVGMSLAEVEAIMGQKANIEEAGDWITKAPAKAGEATHVWASASDGLILVVSQNDRVTFKGFSPAEEMTIVQRIGIWFTVR